MDGSLPNNLEAFFMPFTANRQFKSAPRILVEAEGMYFKDQAGRRILDGTSGLWCVNAGHGRKPIVIAVVIVGLVILWALRTPGISGVVWVTVGALVLLALLEIIARAAPPRSPVPSPA